MPAPALPLAAVLLHDADALDRVPASQNRARTLATLVQAGLPQPPTLWLPAATPLDDADARAVLAWLHAVAPDAAFAVRPAWRPPQRNERRQLALLHLPIRATAEPADDADPEQTGERAARLGLHRWARNVSGIHVFYLEEDAWELTAQAAAGPGTWTRGASAAWQRRVAARIAAASVSCPDDASAQLQLAVCAIHRARPESGVLIQPMLSPQTPTARWHVLTRNPGDGAATPLVREFDLLDALTASDGGADAAALHPLEREQAALRAVGEQCETVLREAVRLDVHPPQAGQALVVLDCVPIAPDPDHLVAVAVRWVEAGLWSTSRALRTVTPHALETAMLPRVAAGDTSDVLATGLPACAGAATGRLCLQAEQAVHLAARGEAVILVREETAPEDVRGVLAARAIVTLRGGVTSHAAVVARQVGRPCVVGASGLRIDTRLGVLHAGAQSLRVGDVVTVDGTRGLLLRGPALVLAPTGGAWETLLGWADERRTVGVMGNADRPEDIRRAIALGAEGIGLVRTEHLFLQPERLDLLRAFLLSTDPVQRATMLRRVQADHQLDIEALLEAAGGLPITIRLLDPPLHEFLPHGTDTVARVASLLQVTAIEVEHRAHLLDEANPMLGHRGVRLALTHRGLYEAQASAVYAARAALLARGVPSEPRLLVPLIADPIEMQQVRARLDEVHAALPFAVEKIPLGAMIELPRACLLAAGIAAHADFLSFGTNDLTQMVWGFSRDDAAAWLPTYLQTGVLEVDPFAVLDLQGVGALIQSAVDAVRADHPTLPLAVCGEHGGDAQSVGWLQERVDAVSCSAGRIPLARLAAARAKLASRPSM